MGDILGNILHSNIFKTERILPNFQDIFLQQHELGLICFWQHWLTNVDMANSFFSVLFEYVIL